MERLTLICEGGAHTVEYFHKNGVYPHNVVFDTAKFKEMVAYFTKDDEVLVVIQGLTDFTLAEVYNLINDIKDNQNRVKNVELFSNIFLGHIDFDYYLYKGDLFYPDEVLEVRKGKILGERKKREKKNIKEKNLKSTSLDRYKKYNDRNVKIKIYGSKSLEVSKAPAYENEFLDKIVIVDLFQKKG